MYVITLLTVELLLLSASFLLHFALWLGREQVSSKATHTVVLGTFLSIFPVAVFGKDRNIWKNEFRSCPSWLRSFVLICLFYGMVVAICQLFLFPMKSDPDGLFVVSAFTIAFCPMFLCVLYSVLWRSDWGPSELVKRSGISFAVAVAMVLMFTGNRNGYLSHRAR